MPQRYIYLSPFQSGATNLNHHEHESEMEGQIQSFHTNHMSYSSVGIDGIVHMKADANNINKSCNAQI